MPDIHKNNLCSMMIALFCASKQHNLRTISMLAKSKYFAKLRSEVLRVKSDEASSKKSYRHARVGDLQKGPGMPQKGGTKVVSMSSIGTAYAVLRVSAVDGGAGSRLVLRKGRRGNREETPQVLRKSQKCASVSDGDYVRYEWR